MSVVCRNKINIQEEPLNEAKSVHPPEPGDRGDQAPPIFLLFPSLILSDRGC